jgi:hypothetical protein
MLLSAGEKTLGIVRQITASTGGFEKGNLVEMASLRLQAMREQTRLARQDPTPFSSVQRENFELSFCCFLLRVLSCVSASSLD